jgi:hypothetical protein
VVFFTSLLPLRFVARGKTERMVIMKGGILLFGIVLCISLLVRLLISQFFPPKMLEKDTFALLPFSSELITPGDNNHAKE